MTLPPAHRQNNFDGLRLLAAFSVLFTHAFVIAEGNQQREPFVILTGYQCPIGLIGVFVFFIISGYLVSQSWFSTDGALSFAAKRLLRIYPGLIVNLLFCAFIVGPFVTTLSLHDYWQGAELPDFLQRNLALELGDHRLPGVLFLDNEAGTTVNGSLWTLRYELMMYGMIVLLAYAGLMRRVVTLGALCLGIAALYWEKRLDPFGDLGEWAWFLGFFAGGMSGYFLRDTKLFGWKSGLAALVGLIIAAKFRLLIVSFPLFGTILVLSIALGKYSPVLNALRRFGDLSYGVYIYGWPVEAWVAHSGSGRFSWWQVLAYSIPPTLVLAWLSWHGVEKRAIRFSRGIAIKSPAPV